MFVFVVICYIFDNKLIVMDTTNLHKAEEALLKQLEVAQREVTDLEGMIENIRKLQKKEPIDSSIIITKSKKVYPTKYSEDLKMYQKVYIALSNLKQGDVHDVVAELKRLNPKEFKDKEYTRKFAANGLYQLLKQQRKITAHQEGLNYIYKV